MNGFKAESPREYQIFFENMAQGVFNQLADGTLVDVNPAALEMFGMDRDQFLGRTSFTPGWKVVNEDGTDILPDQHPSMLALRTGLPVKNVVAGIFNAQKKDFVWLIINAIPLIRKDEDTPYQVFVTLHNITDRKRTEAALKESNEELDAFVYTISHDLRTSITPIIGYADLLREDFKEHLNEQGLTYLSEIEKAGAGMLTLMQSLLDLAKAAKLEPPQKSISTDKVVAGVIKNLTAEISHSGVVMQVKSLPSVYIPKTFLIQIFDNLISNAIRYAGNSGDTIEVGGEHTGNRIRFFVRDHGPGISEQERKHIFEIFYRGDGRDKVKGSGVGLAIVQKIARNCGGRSWVEETPGGGCTFWFELEETPRH